MGNKIKKMSNKLLHLRKWKNSIKFAKSFVIYSKSPFIFKLFSILKEKYDTKQDIVFVIEKIVNNGFVIKSNGVFGFIPFYLFLWQYETISQWYAVIDQIKGKQFLGKVHSVGLFPPSLIVNSDANLYKSIELVTDKKYQGIVTKITNYGIYVDIGYHFNWKNGSFFGLLHNNNICGSKRYFEKLMPADIVEVTYWGKKENNSIVFGNCSSKFMWFDPDKINHLIKTPITAFCKQKIDDFEIIVNEKYRAVINSKLNLYPNCKGIIKSAVNNLLHGDKISASIIKVNYNKKVLVLKWDNISEINEIASRKFSRKQIRSFLSEKNKTVEIEKPERTVLLDLVGKEIVVLVKKYNNTTKYLSLGKYDSKIPIKTNFYQSRKYLVQSALNKIPDGETINCMLTDINLLNGKLILVWNNLKQIDYYGKIKIKKKPTVKHTPSKPVNKHEKPNDNDNILSGFIDQYVSVKVVKQNNKTKFIAEGKYNSIIPLSKEYYGHNLPFVRYALRSLTKNDTIHCKVINYDRHNCQLHLYWDNNDEISYYSNKSIPDLKEGVND